MPNFQHLKRRVETLHRNAAEIEEDIAALAGANSDLTFLAQVAHDSISDLARAFADTSLRKVKAEKSLSRT